MNTANIVLKPISSEYSRALGTYRELRLFVEARAGEELDEAGRILEKGEVFLSCHVRSICVQSRHGPDPEWAEPKLQAVRLDCPPDPTSAYRKADDLSLADAREMIEKLLAINPWTHGMTSLTAVLEGLLAYIKPERIVYDGPTDYRKEYTQSKMLSDVKGFEKQVKPAQGAVQRVFDLMVGV